MVEEIFDYSYFINLITFLNNHEWLYMAFGSSFYFSTSIILLIKHID